MKRALKLTVAAAGLLLVVSSQAQAQMLAWGDHGFINVNVAFQSRSTEDVTGSSTFAIYDETATLNTAQTIDGQKAFFDIGAGARVYKNFGLAFGFSQLSKPGDGTVSASVPHPIRYDSPRTATASVEDLEHKERALHFAGVFVLPVTSKFDLALSAGPTYFTLSQDLAGDAQVSEVGAPFTAVTMSAVEVTSVEAGKWGFNIGADATFKFAKNVGVGGFVRYSAATITVDDAFGGTVDLKVGGLHVGGGVRIRF